jgi:hypothetical protein
MKTSYPTIFWGLAAVALGGALWAMRPSAQTPASGRVGPTPPDVLTVPASGQPGVAALDAGTHLSNRELATESDLIAIGQAVEISTVWADEGRNLYTLARIAVSETLKGDPAASVTVALPGGVDANRKIPVAMTYPGAPRISQDEEVFLFLINAGEQVAGAYAVTGFSQGKFSIEPAAGGAALRTLSAAKMVRVGGALVPLSTFTEEIRRYVQQ